MEKVVRVGVAVFLFNEAHQILIGKRKGSHGAGTWGLPGGHIEFGENVSWCAGREVFEETGLSVDPDVQRLGWSEAVFEKEQKHYITVLCKAWCLTPSGNENRAKLLKEPDKCEEWKWVSEHELPEPLFPPLASYLLHNEFPKPPR